MPRRQFQVGPSTYMVERGAGGFYIVEVWWNMRTNGEQEDMQERVAGPYAEEAPAAAHACTLTLRPEWETPCASPAS